MFLQLLFNERKNFERNNFDCITYVFEIISKLLIENEKFSVMFLIFDIIVCSIWQNVTNISTTSSFYVGELINLQNFVVQFFP